MFPCGVKVSNRMNIVIVGGGASGMMAAYSAAANGHEVTLLEQNEKLGKKIYITGKGRCNLTNNCPIDEFYGHVVRNPKFLYSAFGAWDNADMIRLLNEAGCETKVERGDRVFPVSDHASSVTKALTDELKRLGVKIRLNTHVSRIMADDGCVKGVICSAKDSSHKGIAEDEQIPADAVILCCGGMSYPTTGSDGNGYKLAEKLGHTIITPRPSLVSLKCSDHWIGQVQGLSLKNVGFSLKRGKKIIYNEMGEMLFTADGISGPLVLTASSVYESQDLGSIDLKPALDRETLDRRLIRDFEATSNKNFANSLDGLLPKSLIPVIVELSGIDPYKKVHQVTGNERGCLVDLIKDLKVDITGTGGFDEAVVTRGGINVKEINPSTMESKLVKGLYFAGEMIDVDAHTGGFNLQIAWSTGYLAGNRLW